MTTRSPASGVEVRKMLAGLRSRCRARMECRSREALRDGEEETPHIILGEAAAVRLHHRGEVFARVFHHDVQAVALGILPAVDVRHHVARLRARKMDASLSVSRLSWSLRPPRGTCLSTHFRLSERRVQSYTRPYV